MQDPLEPKFYPPREERLNVITHATGLFLSIIGLYLLITKASGYDDLRLTVSFVVFGISMILLYSASTFYHAAKDPKKRYMLKIFDHIAIFFLIAGTYTPFAVVTLQGSTGSTILAVVWGIVILGTVLKIFFTGKYKILSTLLYVGMGWVIIFALEPLMTNLATAGLWWMLAGGIAYTLGAILYNITRIKFNHAIFHIFVLLGTFCHYMSIYFHVTPQ